MRKSSTYGSERGIVSNGYVYLLIQIPSVYKWGAEKGRIQMFILIILVTGLIGGAIYLLTTFGIGVDFNNIIEFIKNYGIYVTIIFIGIMYFISYRLSCKIFQKKEL